MLTGFCERGDEASGSMKFGNFVTSLGFVASQEGRFSMDLWLVGWFICLLGRYMPS